jgi:cytochrome P450
MQNANISDHRCLGRGLAWMHIQMALAKVLENFDDFELTNGMTDDDMILIERGALAKPKSTKLWVKFHAKKIPGFL